MAKSGQVIVGALSRVGVGLQLKSHECPTQVGTVGNYAVEAAEAYRDGRSRNAYQLGRNIKAGMCAISRTDEAICLQCKSLLDLNSIFDSFVHSGGNMKRHKAIYPEPAGSSCANVKIHLIRTVFDYNSNYLYHQNRTTLVASIHCL